MLVVARNLFACSTNAIWDKSDKPPTEVFMRKIALRFHEKLLAGFAKLVLVALTLMVPTSLLFASDRIALVIGNSAYQAVQPLPNPKYDAQDLAAKLEELGFDVTVLTDLTKSDFEHSLRSFSRSVRRAEMALIFFAGHGIGHKGQSWLIPVDAELAYEDEVELEAISAKQLLKIAGRARGLGLVILDSCRTNSFEMASAEGSVNRSISRGLPRIEPFGDTLLWYAAEEGKVAADGSDRNSPFTAALLRQLDVPGLELDRLFREVTKLVRLQTDDMQSPAQYGSRTEDFYFFPAVETLTPENSEEKLELTRTERREVQTYLAVLEFGPNVFDGHFSAQTRNAIQKWQRKKEIDTTGYLTLESYKSLKESGENKLGGDTLFCQIRLEPKACETVCKFVDVGSCTTIGQIFLEGKEAEKDYATAKRFFKLGCDQRAGTACAGLAFLFLMGLGLEKDVSKAHRYYKRGCKNGNSPAACAGLAHLYNEGLGAKKNKVVARQLLSESCDGGFGQACFDLGQLFLLGGSVAQNVDTAIILLSKGCDVGYGPACFSAGFLYHMGAGIVKDAEKARRFYNLGCEVGDQGACRELRLLGSS